MKKTIYLTVCIALVAFASSWLWTTQAVQSPPAPVNAEAPTDDDLTLRTLSTESELIVRGRCLETQSQWVENNRVLVTLATIEIDETLKGGSTSTVTVVLPGGADLNRKFPVAMTYAGAPSIAQGEEVFLFLISESLVPGGFSVSGFAEGKFSVLNDENGGKVVSTSNIRGNVKADQGLVRGQRRFVPLSEFKNKVQQYVGQ